MKLKILSIESKCTGCCACMNICKQEAVHMKENAEGFIFPEIDQGKCNLCRMCERVCPVCTGSNIMDNRIQDAYYGWHKDDNIRQKSSSGGIFSGIAESFLEKNGIIFGAVYDYKQRRLTHRSSDEIDWSLGYPLKAGQIAINFLF